MQLKSKTPNTFTMKGFILYNAVIVGSLALMLTRNHPNIWHHTTIGSHLSNFALTVILLFTTCALSMLTKTSWRYIAVAALIMLVANFGVELFLTILNTRDMVDALYGTAGIAVTLVLLYGMSRFGITPTKR